MTRTTHAPDTKHRLLERVLGNRRDDQARRVYADWLASRGDPRGEFIHLQLDRAQGRGDLNKLAREVALLDDHREQWGKPLDAVASDLVFDRGFPAYLTIDPARGAALLPQLASNLAWGTIEGLCVRPSREPLPANILAPLIDAPHMRELSHLAGPFDTLLGLAAPRLRYWRAVTVLTPGDLLELCGHLPRLTQFGIVASYADTIKPLCDAAPLAGRIHGLEVLWVDNAHAGVDFPGFFTRVEASAFGSLHWVDTSVNAELFMRRATPGGRWTLEGDVYAIDDSFSPATAAGCDVVTLYADAEVDEADQEAVRQLFEGVGATVRIEVPKHTRWIPLP